MRYRGKVLAVAVVSLALVFAMVAGMLSPIFGAYNLGETSSGDPIVLEQVRFILKHRGFDFVGGYFEFSGRNLENIPVFVRIGGEAQAIGVRTINTNNLVVISLTKEDIERFSGELLVGGLEVNLDVSTFPNIQSANKGSVVKDNTPEDKIKFTGSNLNKISTNADIDAAFAAGEIVAVYGAGTNLGGNLRGANSVLNAAGTELELTNPLPPGRLGYQDIYIRREKTVIPGSGGGGGSQSISVRVEYQYLEAFRILEKMDVGAVTMYPNTGAKGDTLYIESNNLNQANTYEVYFLKTMDGSDRPSQVNKAEFVSLGIDVDGTDKDVITVKVPKHVDFETGTYYVLLTKMQNNQIIAEQFIKTSDGANFDQYAVIQASFNPQILSVHPPKGPDTGSEVEVQTKNVVTLNIPDLISDGKFKETDPPQLAAGDTQLIMNYNDGTYKEDPVTIERRVNMTIGKKVKFTRTGPNPTDPVNVTPGLTDKIMVRTDQVNDADQLPFRDVVIEMVTTLTVKDGGSTPGKKYIFRQLVRLERGFEYVPSTYTPVIDSVTPNVIHVEPSGTMYKMHDDMLISIKGDKFLVDRMFLSDGTLVVNMPSVFIKKDSGNTLEDRYQVAFLPNAETTFNGAKYRGLIFYKSEENGTAQMLTEQDGRPITLEMIVLTDKGQEVDGTEGNQIGQNIIIRIPKASLIKDVGSKHLMVTNPRRKSTAYGGNFMVNDVITYITTTDTPVIEKVEPNIVTVGGGDEITVTGANIAPDAKLFLDGNEVGGFTSELDPSGSKTLIKFKAPAGREGLTQLLIQNPSGGIAAADFTYINSFDKDPRFDKFNPPAGTYGTVVVVDGDNFLKPDPTAVAERGLDAYRLIGTRMLIDGKEVDDFKKDTTGRIVFDAYTSPKAEALIKQEAGLARYSMLAENATVTYSDGGVTRVAVLGVDGSGNPKIIAGDKEYAIRAAGSGYQAFAEDGSPAGAVTITFSPDADQRRGTTTIAIAGAGSNSPITFTAKHDNYIYRMGKNEEGEDKVFLANYAESVTLKDGSTNPPTRFTLSYNFKREPVLTNGKDKTYTLKVVDGAIKAVTGTGAEVPVTVTPTGITLDGVALDMITPYKTDSEGRITGHKSKIVSRTQIIFEVPVLESGRGYKDLVIINPDTKRASKLGEQGFFYIPQASSKPVISSVSPTKGSVDGGYYVTITGAEFDGDARVFVDGVEVPKANTHVALNGRSIVIKMVPTGKRLAEDYGVDKFTVPVVVLNPDGGTANKKDGFTYIIPKSSPAITQIIPNTGSSSGSEIVEVIGYEFRFYEPYENLVGDPGYQEGDKHEDIFPNAKWDDLLSEENKAMLEEYKELISKTTLTSAESARLNELKQKSPIHPIKLHNNPFYDFYYVSKVLPSVYFGEKEARIVEFTTGYIKVLTPPNEPGNVEVYVINNDSGVSNKVTYSYQSTKPVIDQLIPDFGKRGGNEPKEIFGQKLFASEVYGYLNDPITSGGNPADPVEPIALLPDVQAIVRFGNIDNTKISRIEENSGLINNQRTTVNLEGGLTLQYYGDQKKIKLSITERNIVFSREFKFDPNDNPSQDGSVLIPAGMLRDPSGNYYVPTGLVEFEEYTKDPTVYKQPYEYIRVYIKDRRMMVERGYAPKVYREGDAHVTVYTPSYYSIGTVNLTYTNPDGGQITKPFTYTNPSSVPKILKIEPQTLSFDEKQWLVESSVLGNIDIEILGLDFRPNVQVTIGDKPAVTKELTKKTVDGKEYDVIVVTVPAGREDEIGRLYPVIVSNEDRGLATSNNLKDLIGPNHNSETLPYYLVYRKPLSFPRIDEIHPKFTSVAGGNQMVITGSDFREGAYVIIGTRAGIPIYSGVISDHGSKLTFKTPTNMTLGVKDVQVLNTDYGTAVVKSVVTVVSAPTVLPGVTGEDGKPLKRIHVTGDQVIIIKGTGFDKGAKVYFGGEWTLAEQNPDNVMKNGEGLYKDDKLYYVKDGALATKVEFVDSQTLKVTTPAVTKEGEISIVVINGDGGITDDSVKLEYRVPIPEDPYGLKATVVDNRYIKLYDYVSETAKYFEIYAYIGSKTDSQLISNKYQDFTYLGVTDVEPYKIIELPGWDKMHGNDRIVFVVKGVNKFGQSGWSNLAQIKWEQMKDVKELGPENIDGEIGVDKGKDFRINKKLGMLEVLLANKVSAPVQNIDAEPYISADTKTRRITVPEELIKESPSLVTLNLGDTMIRLSTTVLNTKEFRDMDYFYYAYGNVQEELSKSAPTPLVRGRKAVSPVYMLSFSTTSNNGRKDIRTLSGSLDYSIKVPSHIQNPEKVEIYRYNEFGGTFEKVEAVYDPTTRFLTVKSSKGGFFVLMIPLY